MAFLVDGVTQPCDFHANADHDLEEAAYLVAMHLFPSRASLLRVP